MDSVFESVLWGSSGGLWTPILSSKYLAEVFWVSYFVLSGSYGGLRSWILSLKVSCRFLMGVFEVRFCLHKCLVGVLQRHRSCLRCVLQRSSGCLFLSCRGLMAVFDVGFCLRKCLVRVLWVSCLPSFFFEIVFWRVLFLSYGGLTGIYGKTASPNVFTMYIQFMLFGVASSFVESVSVQRYQRFEK